MDRKYYIISLVLFVVLFLLVFSSRGSYNIGSSSFNFKDAESSEKISDNEVLITAYDSIIRISEVDDYNKLNKSSFKDEVISGVNCQVYNRGSVLEMYFSKNSKDYYLYITGTSTDTFQFKINNTHYEYAEEIVGSMK